MMTDDTELVKRAINGDASAFAALLERHYDLIYRVSFRMLSNAADAEDLTQDICVALAGKLERFGNRSKLTTWLYQVTMNATRDFLRRRSTIQRIQTEFVEVDAMNRQTVNETSKQMQWAYEAINSLPDDLRETALLVVAEGLNHAEAAKILEIREATVSWRMMNVRKKLKALANAQGGWTT